MYGPDYHCTASNQKDSVHPGHANAFEIIETCKARGGTARHCAIASTKEKKEPAAELSVSSQCWCHP
jgi:hypothetical protein